MFLLMYKSERCVCFGSPRLSCHHGIEFQLCRQLMFVQRFSQLDPLDLRASETTLLKALFMTLISFPFISSHILFSLFHSPCHIFPCLLTLHIIYSPLFLFLALSFLLFLYLLLLFFFFSLFSCALFFSGTSHPFSFYLVLSLCSANTSL